MESFKSKAKLSRKFSSRKSLGSLKTRFKRFITDHQAKIEEAEAHSSSSSESGRGETGTSSPPPGTSGEIKRSSGSSSSSDSDEGSPSKGKEKSDSSSDSSSEKKRKQSPQNKSSRKKLHVQLQEPRESREIFRLPTLEETPPTSPQSNPPRFSTGGLSDYAKLWTNASAPNSPANLAHNRHLSYRGGDSSPVALIHSLSGSIRGKPISQLSEISLASPLGSGSLDLDAFGVNLEEMKASPSKTTPPLKPDGLPVVDHDEEQGVWRCGSCGWIYPNPNPSLRNRREHKRHCGELSNVQRWLGSQDIPGTSGKGPVDFSGPSEQWDTSGEQPKWSPADERAMVGEVQASGSPEHHTLGSTEERNSDAVADPDEVDDHLKVNRALEWPSVEPEMKDQDSSSERPSNGSSKRHEVEDPSTLEEASNGSSGHHGAEEISKLDDSLDEGLQVANPPSVSPEVENEIKEPTADDANSEKEVDDIQSPQTVDDEPGADESQVDQKQPQEPDEIEDVQEEPVHESERLEESAQPSLAVAHSNGHDEEHVENTADLREEEEEKEVQTPNVDSSDSLDHPHDTQLTDVPDVSNEPPAVPSEHETEAKLGTDDLESVSNQDESDSHTPSESPLQEEAGPAEEEEKVEPRATQNNGKPIEKAPEEEGPEDTVGNGKPIEKAPEEEEPEDTAGNGKPIEKAPEEEEPEDTAGIGKPIEQAPEVQEPEDTAGNGKPLEKAPEVTEPSLSTAKLHKGKEQVVEQDSVEAGKEESNGHEPKAVPPEATQVDRELPQTTDPSLSQSGPLRTGNGHSETEKETKSNGDRLPDHKSPQKVAETASEEVESPAQGNGNKTENAAKSTGSPSSLEEAPKWMTSGMVNSPDEVDKFSSVQKYWADVTSSKYLLVEGKRSPSFGRSDDVGFHSFRNGDGRKSPSPFSLNKSELPEIQSQSSLESVTFHISVGDKEEDRVIPVEAITPVEPVLQHHGSSSSTSHGDYDLEKVVHDQRTHDLICPVCGSDVTKRIILRKRKRTLVPEDEERLPRVIVTEPAAPPRELVPQKDDDDETWGCLACLSFFIRKVSGGGEQESGVSGESAETEQERVGCLPRFFLWVPASSDPELQQPLLGDTPRDESAGEISEPAPGRIREVPLDDDDAVTCFSYLQRYKGQPAAPEGSEPAKEADSKERPGLKPVTPGRIREIPLDEDEKVNCFSYLQRSKVQLAEDASRPEDSDVRVVASSSTEPVRVGAVTVPQVDDNSQVVGLDDTGEKRILNCLPELGPALAWGPIPVFTHPPLDTYEFPEKDKAKEVSASPKPRPSHKPEQKPSVEEEATVSEQVEEAGDISREFPAVVPSASSQNALTEEQERCECLPIFSFTTERFFSVRTATDPETPPPVAAEPDPESPPSVLPREPIPGEDPNKDGASESLPPSVPAFHFGSSSKYDFPSPRTPSPHKEIARGAKKPELPAAQTSPASSSLSAQHPQSLEDADEKKSCNCVPELLPAFSWKPISMWTHPPLETEESSGVERPTEAGTSSSSVAQEPKEDAEEKGTCNCVPELLPPLSWGPIPVWTHDPLEIDDLPGREAPRGAQAGRPAASSTQVPRGVEDEETRSSNCLAEVFPSFSWGTGREGTSAPSVAEDDKRRRRPAAPGTGGRVQQVPLDDEVLGVKGKGVVGEGERTSTSVADDTSRADVAAHDVPSHVETESKESICVCIPLLLPAFHWGFTKRTTHEDGLREPLLPPAGPESLVDTSLGDASLGDASLGDASLGDASLGDTSLGGASLGDTSRGTPSLTSLGNNSSSAEEVDDKQTTGVPEAVLLHGLEDGVQAPPSGPGATKEPVISVVEREPSKLDLSEGTEVLESEEFHIEGHVTSRKTFATSEPSEDPPEANVRQSDYQFEVDIKDGHFTSAVEKLQPKRPRPLIDVSNGDLNSSTDSASSSSGALARVPPGALAVAGPSSVIEGDLGDIGTEVGNENVVYHLADAIKGQLAHENGPSPGLVSPPVESIIRRTFPADEIQAETESRQTTEYLERDSCNCVPVSLPTVRWWGPSRGISGGIDEHLLANGLLENGVEKQHGAVQRGAVERGGVRTASPTAVRRRERPADGTGEDTCSCLPSFAKTSLYYVFRDHHLPSEPLLPGTDVDDLTEPLLGRAPPKRDTVVNIDQTTETNITVENAPSEEAAIAAIARAQERTAASRGETISQEYLKSIVHGGLDVTLVSLGVVASGAGGDAKTLTVIAMGLAFLVSGFVTHASNVMSLFYNNRTKFQDEVGDGFIHGCLSFISFLFFGALAPIAYGFSFRNAQNRDYKFATVAVVAFVALVLLGGASAHVKSKSAVRVITLLVVTGFVAAIAGYETGNYVVQLLEHFGFSSV